MCREKSASAPEKDHQEVEVEVVLGDDGPGEDGKTSKREPIYKEHIHGQQSDVVSGVRRQAEQFNKAATEHSFSGTQDIFEQ